MFELGALLVATAAPAAQDHLLEQLFDTTFRTVP
jgi:hypothetical protein